MRNKIYVLLWLAISGIVCVDSIRAGIGTFQFPGAGFFPFWLGVILGILALVLVIVNHQQEAKGKITNLWKGTNWSKVIFVMVLTLIYSILLKKLGYLITTFLLIVILFCMARSKRIWTRIAIAVVVVLASYLIFCFWLKVPLPKGVLFF